MNIFKRIAVKAKELKVLSQKQYSVLNEKQKEEYKQALFTKLMCEQALWPTKV